MTTTTTDDATVQAEMAAALGDYDKALSEGDFIAVANAQARINALRPPLTFEPNPTTAEMDPVENELEKASPLERALLDGEDRSFHLKSGLTVHGKVTDIHGLTFTIRERHVEWTVLADAVEAIARQIPA